MTFSIDKMLPDAASLQTWEWFLSCFVIRQLWSQATPRRPRQKTLVILTSDWCTGNMDPTPLRYSRPPSIDHMVGGPTPCLHYSTNIGNIFTSESKSLFEFIEHLFILLNYLEHITISRIALIKCRSMKYTYVYASCADLSIM